MIFFFHIQEDIHPFFPGGGSIFRTTPKSVYVYVSRAIHCPSSVLIQSGRISCPNDLVRTPTNDHGDPGVNLARHSLVPVEWPWLLPLSLACQFIVTGGRCLPPIRSMEAPVPRRLCPPPPTRRSQDETRVSHAAFFHLPSVKRNVLVG